MLPLYFMLHLHSPSRTNPNCDVYASVQVRSTEMSRLGLNVYGNMACMVWHVWLYCQTINHLFFKICNIFSGIDQHNLKNTELLSLNIIPLFNDFVVPDIEDEWKILPVKRQSTSCNGKKNCLGCWSGQTLNCTVMEYFYFFTIAT